MADEVLDRALVPSRLGARGQALWDQMTKVVPAAERAVLIGEACRLADRMEKLDLLLCGDIDTWAALVHDLRTEDYELKINSAAVEARQCANAYRQILAQLETGSVTAGGSGAMSLGDELAARRADRASGT